MVLPEATRPVRRHRSGAAATPVAVVTAALRSGLRGVAAALLTGALLAAPAGADDGFGHRHPDGTPLHTHALTSVLVALGGVATVAPRPRRRRAPRFARPRARLALGSTPRRPRGRAPPTGPR